MKNVKTTNEECMCVLLLVQSASTEGPLPSNEQTSSPNHSAGQRKANRLQQNAESMLQRMADKHKEQMISIEKQFLMQKQYLFCAKENNFRELEKKQMREKFVQKRIQKWIIPFLNSAVCPPPTRNGSNLEKSSGRGR
ncbi:hypothetical protein L5515_019657 [Caenorhabditis briggsae]|uniref:Uncharacterized protein n=1 Tax=Caenorhabditis briggsae TaxID=6238 RepID=A0AAE9JTF4_CAEBR|nr:hypothetical protein L5515_019657 [Caenorhabditis briggsae]